MPFNVNTILAEIDAVLKKHEEVFNKYKSKVDYGDWYYLSGPENVRAEILTLLSETIERLAPVPGYGKVVLEKSSQVDQSLVLSGVLRALRDDYAFGRILKVQERIRSDIFSDFLETAEYLIEDEGLKDPAAVLAGGVLEQHIRKLCDKNAIPTTFTDAKGDIRPKKLDTMNADLARQGIYGKNDQKQITAWAQTRNDAAHADYAKYTAEQVKLMITGIRDFIGRNLA